MEAKKLWEPAYPTDDELTCHICMNKMRVIDYHDPNDCWLAYCTKCKDGIEIEPKNLSEKYE